MMGSTSLMIRKPALEVLHHLKVISQDTHPPPKFIFCILYSNLHLHHKYASLSFLQYAPCCHSLATWLLSLTQFLPKNKPATLLCSFKSLACFPTFVSLDSLIPFYSQLLLLQTPLSLDPRVTCAMPKSDWMSKIARVYFCQACN